MEMTIQEAIQQVIETDRSICLGTIVTGFDPTKLHHLRGFYNHNYFDYDGTILYEEADDDCFVQYSVCDENFKVIGSIGCRQLSFTNEDNEICELYEGC